LLHDVNPHREKNSAALLTEIEKILKGLVDKCLRVVPITDLIGRDVMTIKR